MNRLIIIGNGFDLAHGLKTSYHDFILDFLKENCSNAMKEGIKNLDSPPYSNYYGHKNQLLEVNIGTRYDITNLINEINKTSEIKDFLALANNRDVKFNFFFKLLEIGINRFNDNKWVDFEIEYFNELKKIKNNVIKVGNPIQKLNNQFDFFKSKLEDYLKKQQSLMSSLFDRKLLCECFCEDIFDEDVDYEIITTQSPKRLLFLNFNYTNTLEPYVTESNVKIISEINYIHGSVNDENNPPIFGFGDEFDRNFKGFEEEGDNELFKHIKSFGYLKTNNYSKLTRFLNFDKFQVQIYGHSCGLSDRTMFKEIFENKNCLSIKLFYHQKEDGSDDYTEKTYELYRHFSDKNIMRKKIVDKHKSKAMPQPKSSDL